MINHNRPSKLSKIVAEKIIFSLDESNTKKYGRTDGHFKIIISFVFKIYFPLKIVTDTALSVLKYFILEKF